MFDFEKHSEKACTLIIKALNKQMEERGLDKKQISLKISVDIVPLDDEQKAMAGIPAEQDAAMPIPVYKFLMNGVTELQEITIYRLLGVPHFPLTEIPVKKQEGGIVSAVIGAALATIAAEHEISPDEASFLVMIHPKDDEDIRVGFFHDKQFKKFVPLTDIINEKYLQMGI